MSQEFLTLFIRGIEGNTTVIGPEKQLSLQSTVSQLKEVVQSMIKVKVQDQVLIFTTKEMKNECTLAEYNVMDKSNIFLVLKLHGGKLGRKI